MDKNAAFRDKMTLERRELRDWFAGQALAHLAVLGIRDHDYFSVDSIALDAYAHADAMLKIREE